jgi:hypothetical protein
MGTAISRYFPGGAELTIPGGTTPGAGFAGSLGDIFASALKARQAREYEMEQERQRAEIRAEQARREELSRMKRDAERARTDAEDAGRMSQLNASALGSGGSEADRVNAEREQYRTAEYQAAISRRPLPTKNNYYMGSSGPQTVLDWSAMSPIQRAYLPVSNTLAPTMPTPGEVSGAADSDAWWKAADQRRERGY